MKSYNGFSGEQRDRAQRWLNAEWRNGRLKRPSVCCACGQDKGIIDAHAEDYSEPFAAGKTDEFHLCYLCHLMVHCRFGNRVAWDRYRAAIAEGGHFAPFFSRDFPRLTILFLGPSFQKAMLQFVAAPAPDQRPLDEINFRDSAVGRRPS